MNMRIERKAATLRGAVLRNVLDGEAHASNARNYLHPKFAAKFLKYEFQVRPDLDLELRSGDSEASWKVSVITGLLDRMRRVIAVSERYSPEEQRFSGAHELGHLVLHPNLPTLYRDRLGQNKREPMEREADQFAAAYLMPPNWIRIDFKRKFGQCPVRVNEDLAFWLDPCDFGRFLHASPESDLELAMELANCTNTGGVHFPSMCEEYGVTAEAMAWRLIELKLICK